MLTINSHLEAFIYTLPKRWLSRGTEAASYTAGFDAVESAGAVGVLRKMLEYGEDIFYSNIFFPSAFLAKLALLTEKRGRGEYIKDLSYFFICVWN